LNRGLFEQMGQEVVAALAERLRPRGLMLADFPRLTGKANIVPAWRKDGPVNLNRTLKVFVRRHHPDYTPHGKSADTFVFRKQLSYEFETALVFQRVNHYGTGKVFAVHLECACVLDGEPLRWRHALLPFFERGDLEWAYGHGEELLACLEEAGVLLDLVVPEYEAAWLSLHRGGRDAILETMPARGPLSFQEAADIAFCALPSALPRFPSVDAAWLRRNSPHAYFSVQPRVDTAAASGRLAPSHGWDVRFADIEARRTVTVSVPCAGRLGFLLSNKIGVNRDGARQVLDAEPLAREPFMLPASAAARPLPDAPLWRELADSPDVMTVAAEDGGSAFLDAHADCSVLLQLNAETSDPPADAEHWRVRYFTRSGGDLADLGFTISARDRRVLHRSGA
jgi:hypothetical protein